MRQRSELFVNQVTRGRIETRSGSTPYLRFGEWVLLACLVGLVVTAVVAQRRSSRSPGDQGTRP